MSYVMTRDDAGLTDYGLEGITYGSSGKQKITLSASTEKTFILPTEVKKYSVKFSFQPGAFVWVGYGDSAISLPGSEFETTVAELNPRSRDYPGGTILRLITSSTTAEVGIRYDAKANN